MILRILQIEKRVMTDLRLILKQLVTLGNSFNQFVLEMRMIPLNDLQLPIYLLYFPLHKSPVLIQCQILFQLIINTDILLLLHLTIRDGLQR